jgi:hypothetical protein
VLPVGHDVRSSSSHIRPPSRFGVIISSRLGDTFYTSCFQVIVNLSHRTYIFYVICQFWFILCSFFMLDVRDALSGAFGSACLVAAGAPFDTVKVISQTALTPAIGPMSALRRVVKMSGPLALWRGAGPALASACIENVVVFTALGALHRAAKVFRGENASPLSFSGHATLGAFAGVFSATAICPAEVIKVRMQSASATAASANSVARAGSSAWTVSRSLFAAEGMRGFFRGLAPLLARDVPFNGIMFAVQDTVAEAMSSPLRSLGVSAGAREAFAGGVAGAAAWIIVYPLDVIKSRVQVGGAGALAALSQAAKEGKMYRGVSAAILRAFVANGALFWGVDASKSFFSDAW